MNYIHLLCVLSASLLGIISVAQNNFYFSGKIENPNSDSLILIQYYPITYHRFNLNETGSFSDSLKVEEGFYWLSDGEETTEIYLTPNHNLSVFIDAEEFDETLRFTGSLSNENNYKANKALWLESFGSRANYSAYARQGEKYFIQLTDSIYKERIQYLRDNQSISNNFRRLEEKSNEFEHIVALDNYEGMHRFYTKNREFRKSDSFPKSLQKLDFDNPKWINIWSYRNAVENYFNQKVRDQGLREGQDWGLECLKLMERDLKSEKIRNVMALNATDRLTSSKKVDSLYIYLDRMLNDESLKKIALNAYQKVSKTAKGSPSPSFTFKDRDNEKVKLDDFNGKLVYIDIWATWCAPCIAEIPKLKSITNHFKGKDIVFISICQDDTHVRWMKMLKERELVGIQLYASNKDDSFFKDYSVNGIPRFILIDREGTIISPNAKRPSNPKLISELESLLEE